MLVLCRTYKTTTERVALEKGEKMKLAFRKLKPNEIDLRVGRVISTQNFKGVSLLLYKDARVDMDILDETVGATNWKREHTRDNANCIVSIWDDDKKQWVSKEDTGTESNTEAEKGLASDSFKRACVNWGIGRELYSAKNVIVECDLAQDGKKPASGISWFVKEIGTDGNGDISHLVIYERNRRAEREVYRMGVKVQPTAPKPSRLMTVEQKEEIERLGCKIDGILSHYNINNIDELTEEQAQQVIDLKRKALEK